MEVSQERRINAEQPDIFHRLYKSGPQHLRGSRRKTACTKFGRKVGTRMFQASCSADLSHQVFMAGAPSVARPNMRFKPFAALTRDRVPRPLNQTLEGINMRIVLATLMFWLFTECAAAHSPELLVVLENSDAKPKNQELGRVAFSRSEVVELLERKGDLALVRGSDYSHPAWLSMAKLASTSSFRPLNRWDGPLRFSVSSASYDSGQVFEFSRNASFVASFDDNHEPRQWSGHLYEYKKIIWAKPADQSRAFEAWSVFQLRDDGTICILYFDDPSGVQCVGSDE